MTQYKVVEKFVSINGEGTKAGELAVFIRFQGCNLKCTYCDTAWANQAECPYVLMSSEDIVDYVKSTEINNVTLTGGEPLLQENIKALLEKLVKTGVRVEIETNGSVDLREFDDISEHLTFTMDYKLPDSGMECYMHTSNFDDLKSKDTVKFVVSSMKDLEKTKSVIEAYRLIDKCNVYISPVFGEIAYKDIVSYMIENHLNGVHFQLQLHKFIWDPQERGV